MDDKNPFLFDSEAKDLLVAAAKGTPGGFTDKEGQALIDWAIKIRAKDAILESILAGEVVVDIHGMVDADSNVLVCTHEFAQQALEEYQSEALARGDES